MGMFCFSPSCHSMASPHLMQQSHHLHYHYPLSVAPPSLLLTLAAGRSCFPPRAPYYADGLSHQFKVLAIRNECWRVHGYGDKLPSQAETIVEGPQIAESEFKSIPDLEYLQELLAIQQQGPTAIGFFGTRNMGYTHQQLIEVLSYAMVITKNHIYTSGASGTNAAVIRGALRAERPDLLSVILPQSLKRQPPESQELLSKVQNVLEMPDNDNLSLIEASRICNMKILSHVQQVICFAFHDSHLLLETCREAKNLRKIVTLFYLD